MYRPGGVSRPWASRRQLLFRSTRLFPVSGKILRVAELSGNFFLPGRGKALTCLGGRRRSPPWARRSRRIPSGERAASPRPAPWPATWSAPWWGESVTLLARAAFSGRRRLRPLAPLRRRTFAICAEGACGGPHRAGGTGDGATIARHLACLPAGGRPGAVPGASVALVDLARKKHPDRDYQPVTDLLEKGSNP